MIFLVVTESKSSVTADAPSFYQMTRRAIMIMMMAMKTSTTVQYFSLAIVDY